MDNKPIYPAKRTIVINLFGAPGSGKSTGAAYIFSKLKMNGINAELITEFAKDKVWEENAEVFKNQAYLFGKQYFRMSRCDGKVDVIVTDSPLLLSAYYNTSNVLGDEFEIVVNKVFRSFKNMNFFIERVKEYNPSGRLQTEAESDAISKTMRDFLDTFDILIYDTYNGDIEGYDAIVRDVLNVLSAEDR